MLNTPDTTKTILLLGNYRPTLPLARMLKQNGYTVVCGTQGCEIEFSKSRFIDELWDHPNTDRHPEAFLDALEAYCLTHPEIVAVFPLIENQVRLFARHEKRFVRLPPVVMVSPDLIHQCCNKLFMLDLAHNHGVPTAPFALVRDEGELRSAVEKIGLPIVIRPANATIAFNGRKAQTLKTNEELDHLMVDWKLHNMGLILQRKFPGIRHNIYFASSKGKLCRYLHAMITRTTSIDGSGLAVEGRTIEPDPRLQDQTKRLVEALDYTGIGCAQYLVDEETGETSFLEINPRIAGNHAVPELANLRLGEFLLDLTLKQSPDQTPFTGRGGIRYAWSSADLIAAKTALSKKEIGPLRALGWMIKILFAALRAHVHMVYSHHDPAPGIAAMLHALPVVNLFYEAAQQKQACQQQASGNQALVTGHAP